MANEAREYGKLFLLQRCWSGRWHLKWMERVPIAENCPCRGDWCVGGYERERSRGMTWYITDPWWLTRRSCFYCKLKWWTLFEWEQRCGTPEDCQWRRRRLAKKQIRGIKLSTQLDCHILRGRRTGRYNNGYNKLMHRKVNNANWQTVVRVNVDQIYRYVEEPRGEKNPYAGTLSFKRETQE